MFLIELFIPLTNNEGVRFPESAFKEIEDTITEKFGGLTSYPRAPANGIWDDGRKSQSDELLVYEVMTDALDKPWWEACRRNLEERFQQEKILMRATAVAIL
jgi:hypothetical protein